MGAISVERPRPKPHRNGGLLWDIAMAGEPIILAPSS